MRPPIPILIPAFRPGAALPHLAGELARAGHSRVVVVDDGSGPDYHAVFDETRRRHPGAVVRSHPRNRGKGAALRTAIESALLEWPDAAGVVTADADGQHLSRDITRIAVLLDQNPGSLILGSRSFSGKVPLRNWIGNRVSAFFLRVLSGIRLSDTQTGLRGIPAALARRLLALESPRYEFELDMLVLAKHAGIPMREEPIATVYEEGNRSSHFNPLLDSMRITFVLARFSLASLLTAVIDNAVFILVYQAAGNVAGAQLTARLVALLFNYAAARGAVFHSHRPHAEVAPRYMALVAAHVTLSYLLITGLHSLTSLEIVTAKIAVESALFLLNFLIQRDIIFTRRSGESRATDWESYYDSVPITARITRRYSARNLLNMIRLARVPAGAHVIELGGADSCFYSDVMRHLQPALYEAVDTCGKGLDLLAARSAPQATVLRHADIFQLDPDPRADLVFSAGLIEHFPPALTRQAVWKHFDLAKPGAAVLITFPTPTWLYRASRAVLEAAGLWRFHDERPLEPAEVLDAIADRGEILDQRTLWPLILTQHAVAARKRQAP